jgi:hypothetical protein
MEVDEDKPTSAPADQDSSSSQTQKSESASDGPEGTAPVTDNAENAEVRSSGQLLVLLLTLSNESQHMDPCMAA